MDSIGVLTCQALAVEVRAAADDLRVPVAVRALPSSLDLEPSRLYRLIDVMLERMTDEFPQVILAYGHCCFLMGDLARRHRAVKMKGTNCYEILAGPLAMEQLGTRGKAYYLTPFHCRNFDQVLRDGFGDVDHMRRKLAHVARLIYLDTGMDDALIVQARKIAHRLQIPLKVHSAGLDHVRTGLMNAIYRENVNEHTVN